MIQLTANKMAPVNRFPAKFLQDQRRAAETEANRLDWHLIRYWQPISRNCLQNVSNQNLTFWNKADTDLITHFRTLKKEIY